MLGPKRAPSSPPEIPIPKKWMPFKIQKKVQCKRVFVDYEGLSDGRSIKNILSRVAPKKLVFDFTLIHYGSF